MKKSRDEPRSSGSEQSFLWGGVPSVDNSRSHGRIQLRARARKLALAPSFALLSIFSLSLAEALVLTLIGNTTLALVLALWVPAMMLICQVAAMAFVPKPVPIAERSLLGSRFVLLLKTLRATAFFLLAGYFGATVAVGPGRSSPDFDASMSKTIGLLGSFVLVVMYLDLSVWLVWDLHQAGRKQRRKAMKKLIKLTKAWGSLIYSLGMLPGPKAVRLQLRQTSLGSYDKRAAALLSHAWWLVFTLAALLICGLVLSELLLRLPGI